jgi:hypothetical protein
MATLLSQLWSYINPTSDPSHVHFEGLIREEDAALKRNQQIVEEQIALQHQLGACLDRIIKQSPQLTQWMEEIREAPLDQREMDIQEKTALMAILAEAIAFLKSDQELTAYKAQLDGMGRQNFETEAEIEAMEQELVRLDQLIEKFEEDVKKREANLRALMLQRVKLQEK